MVQVTPKPREIDLKMNEEKRVKDTAGGTGQKMPELQTVRFEWPGLQVGPGPEIMVYKSNLRSRPGELPQGMQPVPAIWLTPPRGAPWQYSGLTDSNLANGPAAQSSWHGYRHIFACAGLVVFLLLIMRHVEQYLPQLKSRSCRTRARPGVHVTCELRPSDGSPPSVTVSSEAGEESFYARDKPPAYNENPEEGAGTSADNDKPGEGVTPPFSCVVTSGKCKVPRLHILDIRRDRKLMEKLRLKPGQISVPGRMSADMPKVTKKGHLVIEIKQAENENGCVFGLGFVRDKENRLPFFKGPPINGATPVGLTVKSLHLDEEIE